MDQFGHNMTLLQHKRSNMALITCDTPREGPAASAVAPLVDSSREALGCCRAYSAT